MLGKGNISKGTHQKKTISSGCYAVIQLREAVGAHAHQRTVDRSAADSIEAKHDNEALYKGNVTPEKGNIQLANKTSGEHKFVPLVAYELWRANKHEHARF